MKKLITIGCLIWVAVAAHGQNVFVSTPVIDRTPIFHIPADPAAIGTGVCAFVIGNTLSYDMPLVASEEIMVAITLSNIAPVSVTETDDIGGDWAPFFDWTYISADNQFVGTQNQPIPSTPLGTNGNIFIDFQVTTNTRKLPILGTNGFSCVVLPGNGDFGPSEDDQVSFYTWTTAGVPDLALTLFPSRVSYGSETHFDMSIRIAEVNFEDTVGLIRVLMPIHTLFQLDGPYLPGLTNPEGIPDGETLSNDDWTYNGVIDGFHVFESTAVIPAGTYVFFGFHAVWSPSAAVNQSGFYTARVFGGGEVNTANNADSEGYSSQGQ